MSLEAELRIDHLIRELENFQEIAKTLKPPPGEEPRLQGLDVYGNSLPLRQVVGGDHIIFIDFNQRFDLDRRIARARKQGQDEVAEKLELNRNRAGILLADVAGHRKTDALICAMLHQAFMLGAMYEMELYGEITTRVFELINDRFHQSVAINKYFTMIYGEISTEGQFRFISAAHPAPVVYSKQYGKLTKISSDRTASFPPIGIFPHKHDIDRARHESWLGYKPTYSVNEINLLGSGDILVLYTDGLSEHGMSDDEDESPEERFFPAQLESLLNEMADRPCKEIGAELERRVLAAAPQTDDISYVLIKKS
ncbi:hypothetical protein ABI59_21930 [Acidobacteria bacterium Mor1]|nr:hypothetical protein ABI59_21930 [Acidobacteria bacterium Mor1]